MPRSVRRRSLRLGVLICALLAVGPAALAQASDNSMRVTLNSYGPKVKKDEAAVKSGLTVYTQGRFRPLTRALRHEVFDLRALRAKLITESPSSAQGERAKTDIVRGLGMIATAYATLRHLILVAHGGPVPASQVNAAVSTGRRGTRKLKAGLKLLA